MKTGIALIMTGLFLGTSAAMAEGDALDMEGMSVVGNRELPKALYIVPWKAPSPVDSEIGMSDSLLVNQSIGPLDRDEFRRTLQYHDAFHATK
jgi:hypothetical protein